MLQIILEKVGVKVFFCVSMHITLLFQFKSKLQFIFLSLNSLKSALQPVISLILIKYQILEASINFLLLLLFTD